MTSSGPPTTRLGHVGPTRASYPVIIVGSGYGASVIAARLAERRVGVCVIERGRELTPDELPRNALEVALQQRSQARPLGLFDRVTGDDTDVLVGNALGGTSLINAGVVLEPERSAFTPERWPTAICAEIDDGSFEGYYAKARAALDASVVPDVMPLRKVDAHGASAAAIGRAHMRVPVTVHFGEVDARGARRPACTGCGDCATGCRVGAKNTLVTTYLADAAKHGADLCTQTEVRFVLPAGPAPDDGWNVFVRTHPGGGADPVDAVLRARWVVLGAGALGSTGVLLRSRDRGLSVSRRVGHHLSGNGDRSGYGYNTDRRVDAIGFGGAPSEYDVGPTIASSVRFEEATTRAGTTRPFLVQEGACPSTMLLPTRVLLPMAAATRGEDTDPGLADGAQEALRIVRDQVHRDPEGALGHTMLYLAMGHDDADGRVVLDEDERPRVIWGAAARQPVFAAMDAGMRALVGALGGTWVPNPNPVRGFGEVPLTVHPLGGCPMGDDHERGAVDADGRVFRADGALHDGLFVADGAIVPSSLAANPLLTICALAERIAAHMDTSPLAGWSPPAAPPAVAPTPPIGLDFTETMTGHLTERITTAVTPAEFFEAERLARAWGERPAAFRLSVAIGDLERFLEEPAHDAPGEGYVDTTIGAAPPAPGTAWGNTRRTIERSRFNLFIETAAPPRKRMIYELDFRDATGRALRLEGHKEIHDDPGFDALDDISTLFTSIREGWALPGEPPGPIVAQGVLHIEGAAFLAQLASFRVRHAPDLGARVEALASFGRFFFGELWETYVRSVTPGAA